MEARYRRRRERVTGDLQRQPNHGSELAVLVNIAADVQPEVDQMHDDLPDFNGVLMLAPEDGPDVELPPAEAVHAADVFRTEVRTTIKNCPKHLRFISSWQA